MTKYDGEGGILPNFEDRPIYSNNPLKKLKKVFREKNRDSSGFEEKYPFDISSQNDRSDCLGSNTSTVTVTSLFPTYFDAFVARRPGESIDDAQARLEREAQARLKLAIWGARMAAIGVVVKPMAPDDSLARIDLKPVGRRGQDDKDLGRRFPEPKFKIEKPRFPREESDKRFNGDY